MRLVLSFLSGLIVLLAFSAARSADAKGSFDAGVPRMPGYEICAFDEKANGTAYFLRAVEETVEDVEIDGRVLRLRYCAVKAGINFEQILDHARKSILAQGGHITFTNGVSELTGTYLKGGKEVWVSVYGNEKEYGQLIAEKTPADMTAPHLNPPDAASAPAPTPAPGVE